MDITQLQEYLHFPAGDGRKEGLEKRSASSDI
jgi:hypothetical protein